MSDTILYHLEPPPSTDVTALPSKSTFSHRLSKPRMALTPILSTGGRERLRSTIDLYNDAFSTDPLLNYFMNSVSAANRERLRPHVFNVFLECGALNEGIFYHASANDGKGGRGCRALVMKPGKSIDGTVTALRAFLRSSFSLIALRPSALYRVLLDCEGQIHALRKKTFKPGQQFWYLASIATDEVDRGKKLSHALIRELQAQARETGHAVWLEASSPYSQGLYASLGFELVEVFYCGKGSAGIDGLKEKGGRGVPVAAMIWWSDSQKSDRG